MSTTAADAAAIAARQECVPGGPSYGDFAIAVTIIEAALRKPGLRPYVEEWGWDLMERLTRAGERADAEQLRRQREVDA